MDQHLFEAGASSGIPLRGYIQHKVAALVILKRRRRRTTLLFDYSSLISLYILSESRDDGSPVDLYDNTSQTGASVDAEEFFSFDFFTGIPCINRVGVQHYKLLMVIDRSSLYRQEKKKGKGKRVGCLSLVMTIRDISKRPPAPERDAGFLI